MQCIGAQQGYRGLPPRGRAAAAQQPKRTQSARVQPSCTRAGGGGGRRWAGEGEGGACHCGVGRETPTLRVSSSRSSTSMRTDLDDGPPPLAHMATKKARSAFSRDLKARCAATSRFHAASTSARHAGGRTREAVRQTRHSAGRGGTATALVGDGRAMRERRVCACTAVGRQLQAVSCRLQAAGYRTQAAGCRLQAACVRPRGPRGTHRAASPAWRA